MEIVRRFLETSPTRFEAYLALQRALMRRFEARGGTTEEFCRRLAPAFHRRFGPVLLDG
ncbi:hypothetical protein [Longimicrobium sp.]|jgi:hypothetical protein|uniref:hypothetical protein n=1 Tax=Longimicrobium sp. TaxID=2029185 RepID=UPI002ED81DF6